MVRFILISNSSSFYLFVFVGVFNLFQFRFASCFSNTSLVFWPSPRASFLDEARARASFIPSINQLRITDGKKSVNYVLRRKENGTCVLRPAAD